MATDASKRIRKTMEDLLAPELRELCANMRSNTQRLEDFKVSVREMKDALKTEIRELKAEPKEGRLAADRRLEHIDQRPDIYDDVQPFKEQMAELRARQQFSA